MPELSAREAIAGLPDGTIGIVAIATETAAAWFTAGTYGGSSSRLTGLTWGAEDLSADLGAETNRNEQGDFLDPHRLARVLRLAGASAAGVTAIDTVYVDFRNDAGLRREAEEARRDGFTAKMAIHPAQVAIINDVFTPNADADRACEEYSGCASTHSPAPVSSASAARCMTAPPSSARSNLLASAATAKTH